MQKQTTGQRKQNEISRNPGQAPPKPVEERFVSRTLELEGRPDADTEFQSRLERLRATTAAAPEACARPKAAHALFPSGAVSESSPLQQPEAHT